MITTRYRVVRDVRAALMSFDWVEGDSVVVTRLRTWEAWVAVYRDGEVCELETLRAACHLIDRGFAVYFDGLAGSSGELVVTVARYGPRSLASKAKNACDAAGVAV